MPYLNLNFMFVVLRPNLIIRISVLCLTLLQQSRSRDCLICEPRLSGFNSLNPFNSISVSIQSQIWISQIQYLKVFNLKHFISIPEPEPRVFIYTPELNRIMSVLYLNLYFLVQCNAFTERWSFQSESQSIFSLLK